MTATETREYQRGQVALRALTYKDVARLWRMLDLAKLDASFPEFATATMLLIAQRREMSAALARTYIAKLRAGVDGKAPPIPTPALPASDALVALRFKSVVSIKVAMTRGTPLDQASKNALVRTMGVVDRYVGDAGRDLILQSVKVDPAATGWTRRALGTCDFCELLAGRTNGEGETFPRHDHCGCQPEPMYESARRAGLSPDALRNALDPTRNRTRAAILKELEATAEGRALAAAIKQFTETRGGVTNLRKNIDDTLNGTASDAVASRTNAFLDALNDYPPEDVPTLFRGIAVRVEEDSNAWWDAFEAQFQPGQRMNLNASSFSSSEKKAAEFSRMIGGTKKANGNYTAVRLYLENGRALPVESLSKFKAEKEWITGGEFEVVSFQPATKQHPYYRVTIRQVKRLGHK